MEADNALRKVKIREVTSIDAECAEAQQLSDRHKRTLGFLAKSVFFEQADRGRLLVASLEGGGICGYLLFRDAKGRASVVHLCVSQEMRRKGIAKKLVSHLRSRVSHLEYIEARCRQDYEEHAVWPHLGFVVAGEAEGRGKDRMQLTVFRYNLGHEDLFSLPPASPSVIRCAVDTNILIGIQDQNEVCSPLVADWLGSEIELVVTEEVFNDLSHTRDGDLRGRRIAFAKQFGHVIPKPDRFERAHEVAKGLLRPKSRSDARHIARASAGEVEAFITTDDEVLGRAEEILGRLHLRVLHPSELIRELDALQEAESYAPASLAGTTLRSVSLMPADSGRASEAFRYGLAGESDADLKRILRQCFAARSNADLLWVHDYPSDKPLGLLAGRVVNEEKYEVVALRLPPGKGSDTRLMRVLGRHLAFLAADRGCARGCRLSVVVDTHLHPVLAKGLESEGFQGFDGGYARLHLPGVLDAEEAVLALRALAESEPELLEACTGDLGKLAGNLEALDPSAVLTVEERCAPLKVLGAELPCYVVPIKARWAEHLFDPGLASQGLFGADKQLGLAREGVYYRSNHPPKIKAPARVLWYVSDSSSHTGAMAIRASSIVNHVYVDAAHVLFRRNRRLGVWNWPDVLDCAKGDPQARLMAMEFSRSECFETPIPYQEARDMLGTRATFTGPLAISEAEFMEVYRRGAGVE